MTSPPAPQTVPDLETLPRGRVRLWLATLDPGYFAAVMATGIVSISARLLGHAALAEVLLVCTIGAFILLLAAYVTRAVLFPRRFALSLRMPGTAVTYFTVVAGTNVLATGLLAHSLWIPALVMGVVAFLIWLVLTYGLFCDIVLAGNRPLLREITGVWLVWVVGTQSVAVLATTLAPQLPGASGQEMLGVAGVLFWSVGVVLYLILVVIIFLRLFLIETTSEEMGPAYWILMGATAISVRAAAGILALGDSAPTALLKEMRPFVVGLSVVLWSFGSWFIPMLVLFGLWRYFVRGYSWSYEPKLWSVVFPLGMYAVASATLGRAINFDFMPALASVWVWVGVAGWSAVVVLMLLSLVGSLRYSR
ncbi:tellurite resistance/C4-dicarboxylate transporter family protein [Pseudarthrobacter sp. N5]|uniref:tellurite resistance/C4-dicarboxylate transporter family protein n=1 Tax=Pseudarthrobacter sp. N5 TaxID=3418416 RepID=UPI003CFA9A7D